MERRVLIAIFLSFLVLYVYQALVVKPVPKPSPATAKPSTAATTAPASTPTGEAAPATAAPVESTNEATKAATETTKATPLIADAAERDMRVETPDVIAVFTNRGARLKSWRLKRYKDQQGQPQELVENKIPTQPLPFTLRFPDDRLTSVINSAVYAVQETPPAGPTGPTTLRFEYSDSSGLHAIKQFQVGAERYVIALHASVAARDRSFVPEIVWGPGLGDVVEKTRYTQSAEGLLFQQGKVQRLASKDFAKQSTYEGDFQYAGVDDNYFLTAALSLRQGKISYQPVTIPPAAGSKEQPRELVSYAVMPKSGDDTVKFFVGPKDFDVLASFGADYTRAINFGMFAVIVVPLLNSLKWINGFVGNYGWSIVILTALINAIMFPLQHKSIVSMRKMQEIQPEVKAIQSRYEKMKATDPAKQKMNQELMALYRERGVNPASGCVPMLLTFPVLFAMWAMLSTAIELRGAPFVGWIHDLTARDPYYIIPVLMGLTQFWQQKMTPATGVDPAQQRMMMVMPLVMTVMFLWLPAGALIYYTVSGVIRIGQQYFTNYLIGPPNVRTVRPAAERRLKRVGGGKTEAADANTTK